MARIRCPMSLTLLRMKVVDITQEHPTHTIGGMLAQDGVTLGEMVPHSPSPPNLTLCVAHELGMG